MSEPLPNPNDALEALRHDPNARKRINAAGAIVRDAMREAEIERLDLENSSLIKDHQKEIDLLDGAIARLGSRQTIAQGAAAAPRLSEAINAFVEEKESLGRWKEKTLKKYRLAFSLFTRFVTDLQGSEPSMNEVQRDWMIQYLNLLQKLPPNIGRNHAGKGLLEIAALGLLPMSVSSITTTLD